MPIDNPKAAPQAATPTTDFGDKLKRAGESAHELQREELKSTIAHAIEHARMSQRFVGVLMVSLARPESAWPAIAWLSSKRGFRPAHPTSATRPYSQRATDR